MTDYSEVDMDEYQSAEDREEARTNRHRRKYQPEHQQYRSSDSGSDTDRDRRCVRKKPLRSVVTVPKQRTDRTSYQQENIKLQILRIEGGTRNVDRRNMSADIKKHHWLEIEGMT